MFIVYLVYTLFTFHFYESFWNIQKNFYETINWIVDKSTSSIHAQNASFLKAEFVDIFFSRFNNNNQDYIFFTYHNVEIHNEDKICAIIQNNNQSIIDQTYNKFVCSEVLVSECVVSSLSEFCHISITNLYHRSFINKTSCLLYLMLVGINNGTRVACLCLDWVTLKRTMKLKTLIMICIRLRIIRSASD